MGLHMIPGDSTNHTIHMVSSVNTKAHDFGNIWIIPLLVGFSVSSTFTPTMPFTKLPFGKYLE